MDRMNPKEEWLDLFRATKQQLADWGVRFRY